MERNNHSSKFILLFLQCYSGNISENSVNVVSQIIGYLLMLASSIQEMSSKKLLCCCEIYFLNQSNKRNHS